MFANENEKSLLSLIIKNEPGVLSKISSFCGQNNINIEKLTISNFKSDKKEQRMILYVSGNRARINSLLQGLENLDVVVKVSNFQARNYIERELMLVKIRTNDPYLPKITDLVNEYNGSTILINDYVMIFQFTNEEEKNSEVMKRIENITDAVQILQTGVVATSTDDKMLD